MTVYRWLRFLALPASCIVCSGVMFPSLGASYSIKVSADQSLGAWPHFYEASIGTCHPITVLHSCYGRNIQMAMKRGSTEVGFKLFRSHGIFDSDVGIYNTDNGQYNWTVLDSIYDAAKANGMYPMVELGFCPPGLASSNTLFMWYNGAPANVSVPNDFTKWRALVKELVLHCENRYGAAEVRTKWYFEVWNEPDLGCLSSSNKLADYLNIYDYAAQGIRDADSLCRVGGPAVSGCNPGWVGAFINHVLNGTNAATGAKDVKCDFVSYHVYSDDPGFPSWVSKKSRPQFLVDYHKAMADTVQKYGFKGQLINTEWGPTASAITMHSDDESAGTFAAKTIHLVTEIGPNYPPPPVYSTWCLSDIFEEWDSRGVAAYHGAFGMLLMGAPWDYDSASWDVAKPIFNVFKLLHRLGDQKLTVTGGTTADGVGCVSTISTDGKEICALLYNHVDGGTANSALSDSVTLSVDNIPFAPGAVTVTRNIVDRTHSNSFRVWQSLGSPPNPTIAQWNQIKAASQLYDTSKVATLTAASYSDSFTLNTYGTMLVTLQPVGSNSILPAPMKRRNPFEVRVSGKTIRISSAADQRYSIKLSRLNGSAVRLRSEDVRASSINCTGLPNGVYMLSLCNGTDILTKPIVIK